MAVNARLPADLAAGLDQLAERLNARPDRAAGLCRPAGRSEALRTAAETGLAALERRRAGLDDAETKPRVELTPEEEAVREQQRRFAEEAIRRGAATRARVEEAAGTILGLLRERGDLGYFEVAEALRRDDRSVLGRALTLLYRRGEVLRYGPRGAVIYSARREEVGEGATSEAEGGAEREAMAAIRRNASVSDQGFAEHVVALVRGLRGFTPRWARAQTGAGAREVQRALGVLLIDGRIERVAWGVYSWRE